MTTTMCTRTRTDESGTFVVYWLLGATFVGLLFVALVADGSRVFAAISDTSDVAQVAARAAARHIDPNTGLLDASLAAAAAQTELDAAGMNGTVTVDTNTVTVTASSTIDLPLLTLVGKPTHTVESTRAAHAAAGP